MIVGKTSEQVDMDLTCRPINSAYNLPPSMYTSAEAYAAEERAIFARDWIYGCRVDQVAGPGDYFSVEIAGAPIIIVRGNDNVIRAHSAVCRHRAAIVATGQGCASTFRCPYHGWTYGLDGRLIGAPLMNTAEAFDKKQFGLVSVRAEIWENFVFVNLDPDAASLSAKLAPLSERLKDYQMHELQYGGSMDYKIRTNWKLYVENSMEEYHIPVTHPNTLQPIQPMDEWIFEQSSGDGYEILIFPKPYYSEEMGIPPRDDRGEDVATVVLIYPNFLITPSPNTMMTIDHKPIDASNTHVKIDFFYRPELLARPDFEQMLQATRDGLDSILQEDNTILTSTFRGMESPLSLRGRYAFREKVPHRLHQYVINRVREFG